MKTSITIHHKKSIAVNRRYCLLACILIFTVLNSCKKLVEVPGPVTSVSSANVYQTNTTAIAVLNGIYANMSSSGFGAGLSAMSLTGGLSSDELTLVGSSSDLNDIALYHNDLGVNQPGIDYWTSSYTALYTCNAAIQGLTNNTYLNPAVDRQLLGEAKFMRALNYFYLVNAYGDVPLVTGTDYKANTLVSRTPKAQVYAQIIADLKEAYNLLSDQYLDVSLLNATTERVRPTKWAAAALLARTYLYNSQWAAAESESTLVINNISLYSLDPLNQVFLKNSTEAIWQLQPVNTNQNTPDGLFFILPATGPADGTTPVYLSTQLLNSFEPGDQRLVNWVSNVTVNVGTMPTTYYFAYKYKVNNPSAAVSEYEMVFRLAEQYLIRAEARAEQGNTNGAASDLNVIRARAGLPPTTASSSGDLVTAILHERQVELFTEWGHRWLDLKRTGTVNTVMSVVTPQKGGTAWKSSQQLYPLSVADLQYDPELVQNPGY